LYLFYHKKSACSQFVHKKFTHAFILATDPDYTSKLISVIEKYNLNQYDIDACPQYKIDGEKYLRDNSYTLSEHDPLEPVDFGTLGTILMNYNKKHGIA